MNHHTQVCIDLRAFETNIRFFRSLLASPCRLCAVVKADAYGHGLKLLAPVALEAGADCLGIVDNWEAELIRNLNLSGPLIRLRPATAEEVREAAAWGIEEVVGSYESACAFAQLGRDRRTPVPVHLKLDIGINRMSFSFPHHREIIEQVCRMEGLAVRGVMTHFLVSDEDDLTVTLDQLNRFERETRALAPCLPSGTLIHAANSAACLRIPQSRLSMVRLGIALYGQNPSPCVKLPPVLQPVMSWKTRIVLIRTVPQASTIGYGMTYQTVQSQRIATLPVGYADGYVRTPSYRLEVLIRGVRCPVVGRVSMDMTTVDVTHVPEVQEGDEVVLMGRQGSEQITTDELACNAGTISYEITCRIGSCTRNRFAI